MNNPRIIVVKPNIRFCILEHDKAKLSKHCNIKMMILSTYMCESGKTGKGFVNSLIRLKFYCGHNFGDKRIIPLDTACHDHHILHATMIEHRASEKFKAKDTPREEKIIAFIVTNAMKAKRKIVVGCKRKRTTKIKINRRKKNEYKRLILTPGQSGSAIPLIPIFAGLSALGYLRYLGCLEV
ncbi:Uncharacterized protein FWK35_00026781, partial [Aphis craccivora]